jgi:integrase
MAVNDVSNGLSLRDRAIATMLLHTGLRRSDIAELMMDSIDWGNDTIYVTQRKTSVPLELPLSAVVGNAVFDYIRLARPDTADNHLFVREKGPHTSLSSNGIYDIVDNMLNAANIRQEPGARRGTHLFRHRATTTMLESKVQQPVISHILGHTSPRSLEPYLHADFVHLKDCSLDISCFPIAEEVFFDV